MGRSFESVRMGTKEVLSRWLKASRALKKEVQIYGQELAEMAKKHSSEAFYAFNNPWSRGLTAREALLSLSGPSKYFNSLMLARFTAIDNSYYGFALSQSERFYIVSEHLKMTFDSGK